jgi:2-polyprenyl-3-methyl-5-hydroxy-6-metoxy-1,4-benzoquinol methylase
VPRVQASLAARREYAPLFHLFPIYPISKGIRDFIREELSRSVDPRLRRMRFIDRMARIYETKLWYPIVLNVYGGFHSPSLAELVTTVSEKVRSTKGRVLDVACGPGTYGRRIASTSKQVFGIDVSTVHGSTL